MTNGRSVGYILRPFKELPPDMLPAVAQLHQSTLRLLLTDMGYPFILRYYQLAVKDPGVIGFYAAGSSNELLGYVLGSPHPGELSTRLTKPLSWFLGQCTRLFFTRPRVLLQAIVSGLALSRHSVEDANAIEAVYISVNPAVRGRGIGRALLEALHEASRAAGFGRVTAVHELANEGSVGLFSALGYRVLHTFREGRFHRQRVELIL